MLIFVLGYMFLDNLNWNKPTVITIRLWEMKIIKKMLIDAYNSD